MEPLWCLLCEFWSLLVSSGEVFMDFHEFSVPGPAYSMVPLAWSRVLDGPASLCLVPRAGWSRVLTGPACSMVVGSWESNVNPM